MGNLEVDSPSRLAYLDYFRLVARLDRRCLGAQAGARSRKNRSETSSISRLEGSRWRLRWALEVPLAMEFEWVFFRLLFGAKRQRRRFHSRGEERPIPPHTWWIISRAASAAPAASLCAGHAQQPGGESPPANQMEVKA
jgi:hypothetical protein